MKKLIGLLVLVFGLLSVAKAQVDNFYDVEKIQELRITFKHPQWDNFMDSVKQVGSETRLMATCTINGMRFDSVGVKYKGNSSYNNTYKLDLPKAPLNVKLNHIKKGQNYQSYTTLKLSNVFRDPSFIREVLSYEILRNYLPAPQSNFIKVYINNEYFGLYTNVESLNKTFIRKKFGSANGTFFKCDPDWHAQELSDCPDGQKASLLYMGKDTLCYMPKYERRSKNLDDWDNLLNLCNIVTNEANKIRTVMNVDRALWMLAYNNVLVNLDSYSGRLCHNFYIYRDSTNLFQPLIWDLNMSFGGFQFGGTGRMLSLKDMQELSPLFHMKNEQRPLIKQLLNHSRYRKMYLAHLKTILEDYFTNGKYMQRARRMQQVIDREVNNDPNKFYTYIGFKHNLTASAPAGKVKIVGIEELMKGRTEYLKNHPLMLKTQPTITMPSHRKKSGEIQFTIKVSNGEKAYVYYRTSTKEVFKKIIMKDDGNSNDQRAGDGIFGASLETNSATADYYFYVENESTGKFHPARAAYEFLSVK